MSRNTSITLGDHFASFVDGQVAEGRYGSASEVVRDGLRLLEEAEHRRLVEKWIYEDLSEEEMALLPAELKETVRAHFRKLVDDGLRSAEEQGWLDGPETLAEIRARVTARHRKRS